MIVFCFSFDFLNLCMQGKREERRLESLCALEKQLRVVLGLLGLMPASYSEVDVTIFILLD